MPAAIIGEALDSPSMQVDRAEGIVRGCRLAEVNRLAIFAGLDGQPKELFVTPGLIDGLLALCQERKRLSGHWTHDWAHGNQDALLSRVSWWDNFRVENGNLLGDAHLYPGDHKERVMYAAEHDPEGMMVSMVFRYEGTPENPRAVDVRAADFVAKGACTTALCTAVLSALNKNQTALMPDDPTDTDTGNATAGTDDAPASNFTPEQLAELDSWLTGKLTDMGLISAPPAAGGDAPIPPALMSALNVGITGLLKDNKQIAVLAEAAAARKVGSGPARNSVGNPAKPVEKNPLKLAIMGEREKGAKNDTVAMARALNKNPELYQFRASLND